MAVRRAAVDTIIAPAKGSFTSSLNTQKCTIKTVKLMGKVAVIQPAGDATKADDKKFESGIGKEIRGASIFKTAEDRRRERTGDAKRIKEIQKKKEELQKEIDSQNEEKKGMKREAVQDGILAVATFGVSVMSFIVSETTLAVVSLLAGMYMTKEYFSKRGEASDMDGRINELKVELSIQDEWEGREMRRQRGYRQTSDFLSVIFEEFLLKFFCWSESSLKYFTLPLII